MVPVSEEVIDLFDVSPSGKQVAVRINSQNEVRIIGVADGKIQAHLRGHPSAISDFVYRPDGKQVATSGHDDTIRLWAPATGREVVLLKVESAHAKPEGSIHLKYSPEGSRIVSFGRKDQPGTIRLWDAVGGKEIAILGEWQEGGVRLASFSPDGKRVATTSKEYVRVYDAATGRQLAALGPHRSLVSFVSYSPDGKLLASSTRNVSHAIHLWDGRTGEEARSAARPQEHSRRNADQPGWVTARLDGLPPGSHTATLGHGRRQVAGETHRP